MIGMTGWQFRKIVSRPRVPAHRIVTYMKFISDLYGDEPGSAAAHCPLWRAGSTFQTDRALIAEHGEDVAAFLQSKIADLMASRDFEQFATWFVVRNAVASTLNSATTSH